MFRAKGKKSPIFLFQEKNETLSEEEFQKELRLSGFRNTLLFLKENQIVFCL